MTRPLHPRPAGRAGTKPLIAGVMLLVTGVISIALLVLQLVEYDPPCEPVALSLAGPCGVLRLLVLLMLPVTLAGVGLITAGIGLRWRDRHRPAR